MNAKAKTAKPPIGLPSLSNEAVTKMPPAGAEPAWAVAATAACENESSASVAPVIVTLQAPLGEFVDSTYTPRRVDAALQLHHGTTLKRLLAGLTAQGAKLSNGVTVLTYTHAIRWLLEQLEPVE